MSVLHAPDTPYAKERVKYEAQGTEMGPGLRPYVYREFPMMMHKAGKPEGGLGAHTITESQVVESEVQADQLFHAGFRRTPLEALHYLEDQQLEFAKLDAELNYEQRRKLSERASANVDAARAAHVGDVSHHLPAVPVTPIKKRGRPVTVKEN